MKKFLLFAAIPCCMSMLCACSDDDNEGNRPAERIAFDSPALAAKLNTDFGDFRTEYGKFERTRSLEITTVVLGGYLKTDTDSILLRIRVEKDESDRVGSIEASLENTAKNLEVWKYYVTHPDHLSLGRFLGTKFRSGKSSGVHQTIDQTVQMIEEQGTAGTLACTLYGVIPGSAYAVAVLEENNFTIRLMNNYLKLDYPRMRSWLGTDHAAFAEEHYVLGNKISLAGDLYVYFDSAKDRSGNQFTVDVHAGKDGTAVMEIDAYLNEEVIDAEQQMAVWRDYASNAAAYGLGTFKEGYTTDSFGGRLAPFASLAELIAHVDEKGRPATTFDGGVIAVFEADGVATNLVLNRNYIYLLIKDPNYNVE